MHDLHDTAIAVVECTLCRSSVSDIVSRTNSMYHMSVGGVGGREGREKCIRQVVEVQLTLLVACMLQ